MLPTLINAGANIDYIFNYNIFNVVVGSPLMTAFEKLGDVQKQVDESYSDEYSLKTVYGDGQDAKFILKRN